MRNYDEIMNKMTPQNMVYLMTGVINSCEYCMGTGLPEQCEMDGIKCSEGILAYLEQEVEK